MKVFTTAIFAVVLLRKRIDYHQWIALFILALSIILVQVRMSFSRRRDRNSFGHR